MDIKSNHHPLSSVQKEIGFDQMLHPDIPLYNIGGYLRIDGCPSQKLIRDENPWNRAWTFLRRIG